MGEATVAEKLPLDLWWKPLPTIGERAFVEDVKGRRLWWLSADGTIDSGLWTKKVFEVPRFADPDLPARADEVGVAELEAWSVWALQLTGASRSDLERVHVFGWPAGVGGVVVVGTKKA